MPPDFTLDLGFIGSRRDGKPRFRSSAPPPDGAERFGSQRRVSDGARRPRLRAAPRTLPAREILLIPSLHGSALRCFLHGLLPGQQSGVPALSPSSPLWTCCLPLIPFLQGWTPFKRFPYLVPPFTRRVPQLFRKSCFSFSPHESPGSP